MASQIPSGPSFGDKVQNFWEGTKSRQSDEVTVKNQTAIFSTVSIFAEPIFSKEQMDKAGVFGRGLSLLNVVWGGAINFTPLLLVHATIATCCNAVKANTVTNNLSKKIELEAQLLQNGKSIKDWEKNIEIVESKIQKFKDMKNPETDAGKAAFAAKQEAYPKWSDQQVHQRVSENADANIKTETYHKEDYQNNLTKFTENNKEIKSQLREIYTSLGFNPITQEKTLESVQARVISNTKKADELEVEIRELTTEIVNLNIDRPEGYLAQVGAKRSKLNSLQSEQNRFLNLNIELSTHGLTRPQELDNINSSLENENPYTGGVKRVTPEQGTQLREKLYADKRELQKLTFENRQVIKNSDTPQSLESLKEELTLHLKILEANVASHDAQASKRQTGVMAEINQALLSDDVKTCAAARDGALKNIGMDFYALLNQLTYRENLTGPKQLGILKEILNTPQSRERISDRFHLIDNIDATLLKPDNSSEGLRREILEKIDRFAWGTI